METQPIDEDSIDAVALQAQIDLSMSFAQGLVSSWMKPHKFPVNTKRNELEKELKESLRRPPRLGVGAPIPEMQSLSRETARLKGQLVGSKKRARDDEKEKDTDTHMAVSDDEESRGNAFKRKAKADPFGFTESKKKKKNGSSSLKKNVDENEGGHVVASFGNLATKQEGQNKNPSHGTLEGHLELQPVDQFLQNVVENSPTLERQPSPDLLTTKGGLLGPSVPQSSLVASLLKRPLLNLEGSPSDDGHGGDGLNGTSGRKKKRKRRKKKKHSQGGDDVMP